MYKSCRRRPHGRRQGSAHAHHPRSGPHLFVWGSVAARPVGVLIVFAFLIRPINGGPGQGSAFPPATAPAATSTRAPTPTPTATPTPIVFDGERAYEHVLAQMAFGPRPAGSDAIVETGDYIIEQLEAQGWDVETQEFTHRGVPIRNVIARHDMGEPAGEPAVLLGAHYDTRPVADMDKEDPTAPVPGANDGASGVAVLLELARALEPADMDEPVWLAFFDAEDRGNLDGWDFSVGGAYMAENLDAKPRAMVLLDIVGDAQQQIYYGATPTPRCRREIFAVAGASAWRPSFTQPRWTIIDDHLPFIEAGIPAVDLIDFDLPYWHTTEDTADKVSAESLEKRGRVIERG